MRLPTWGEPAVGEVAGPSVCQRCSGEGEIVTGTYEYPQIRVCPDCCCVNCGTDCTTGLCELCDAADLYDQDLRRERGR